MVCERGYYTICTLPPETTSCCFTKFLIFFYQKLSKFKQKLYPFPDQFSQLSYLFTSIIVKFIVWHFLWISFSWKIWIIIGRIVFVIRLLFLHIMLTFVHVLVWISNHIKIIVLENIVSDINIPKTIASLWIFNW